MISSSSSSLFFPTGCHVTQNAFNEIILETGRRILDIEEASTSLSQWYCSKWLGIILTLANGG
jgi:hypothetical protein